MTGREGLEDLIDRVFLSYNAGRLREAAGLYAGRMLEPDVTVGLTLAGALTPAGLGTSCIVPLIEAGFVDWVVSTGANLYHDLHHAFDLPLHAGDFRAPDRKLHDVGVVRIYDVLFSRNDVLLETDRKLRKALEAGDFDRLMGSAEFHHLLGEVCAEAEERLGLGRVSVLAAAHRAGVPVYTSSPGDSTIGMEVACMSLAGSGLAIDANLDVNETAAIIFGAKAASARTGVLILGGGSPKNFALQTEPYIQEVLGLEDRGYDYFVQITDARPDTGGLSGATPTEAVSWGKVDPDAIPDSVVCYADTTLALPLITHYALARRPAREPRRLYDRREELLAGLKAKAAETDFGKRVPGWDF